MRRASAALLAAAGRAATARRRLHTSSPLAAASSSAQTGTAEAAASPTTTPTSSATDAASLDFGGTALPCTPHLAFYGGPGRPAAPPGGGPIPAFWMVDAAGRDVRSGSADTDTDATPLHPLASAHDWDQATAVATYTAMARLQVMDTLFFEAQRQGRFSFYMTAAGEEAATVGSAAALAPTDPVFAQYREHGVLLQRGASFKDMADQCFGNALDRGKGRQMPIHYGDPARAFHTVSSPLATQLPHAVGAAYVEKLFSTTGPPGNTVVAAYFGEGAASEGDFHAAANFAAVLRAPVLFICRNNGWAISTPAHQQYAGDGIAGRGPAYGIPSTRVDGGDARAVHAAVGAARALALETGGPALVECVAYRAGHHSTSDDASRYRAGGGPSGWRARDPASRLAAWLEARGWWDGQKEADLRRAARAEAVAALAAAEKEPKCVVSVSFFFVPGEGGGSLSFFRSPSRSPHTLFPIQTGPR
jgi:2-oxoisovalerate dehydrogenase E1 component alpha subunit